MPRTRSLTALLALLIAVAVAPQAHAQATRTYVSGGGDDANPCSRSAPCRTFAGTISKTAAGGEIDALDSAGYGTLSITKAITIDARGVIAGVSNSAVNGISVNAGAGDDVVLRGLSINGTAAGTGCGYGGLSGVRILRARSVRIEETKITRNQRAIEIAPTADPVDVLVNRVDIGESCTNGIVASGPARVTIQDATIASSNTALSVGDGAAAWLTRSTLFANALALQPVGTGAITDFGDNRLIANAADGAPTARLGESPVAGPPGPAGPAGPAGATGPRGEPAIKLLLAGATSRLKAKRGRTVALSYAATAAATSTLTISRGAKRIATVRARAKEGANTIRWNGRQGKRAAAAGAYTLRLRAVGADGQTATVKVALRVSR